MAVFRVVTVDSDDEVAYPAARDLLKILTSGTIGAAIPAYTGQTAVNTTNGLLYRATGTDAGDWEPHSTLRTLGALTEVSLYEGEVIKFSSTYYLSTATGTDDWQLLIGISQTEADARYVRFDDDNQGLTLPEQTNALLNLGIVLGPAGITLPNGETIYYNASES